jgi:hypothetical protein
MIYSYRYTEDVANILMSKKIIVQSKIIHKFFDDDDETFKNDIGK